MDLGEIEAFLALARELHFGRAGQQLYLSGARVSQRIQAMEREIGGALFDRSSRRVALTPLGQRFLADLEPAMAALRSAYRTAAADARSETGPLRIGSTFSGTDAVSRLAAAVQRSGHDGALAVREVPMNHPFADLRAGEIDAIVHWRVENVPDLTFGPILRTEPRALAMAADHPLAARDSVTVEDLGDYATVMVADIEDNIRDLFVPRVTPSGRPIEIYPEHVRTNVDWISLLARGLVVHPTVPSIESLVSGSGIVLRPLLGLPPLQLCLVWCTANENARIRALARIAAELA